MRLASENSEQQKTVTRRKKFMVFKLGDDRFAIPLGQVKEVIGLTVITPIPDVPKYFKGLVNLRGKIISTLDLRMKLGIPVKESTSKRTCIIISELSEIVLGTLVDDVTEVLSIDEDHIERELDISSKMSREYITGVVKFEAQALIVLLDFGKVLNVDELTSFRRQLDLGLAA